MTIVGISRMALTAEQAAEVLADEHEVEAEVIDPRTLRPLDLDTILASVRKTNRCVIVEEGWPHGGVGANLAALIQEQAFDYLDAPVGARDRRRPADALLQAARADRLPARAADRRRPCSRCSAISSCIRLAACKPCRTLICRDLYIRRRVRDVRTGRPPTSRSAPCADTPSWARPRRRPRRRRAGRHRRLRLHRTARRPRIMLDPTADNTDVYAFTAPDAPGSLTVVATGSRSRSRPAARTSASSIRRRATTSRSTTPVTASRTSPTAGSSRTQFRNPNSFLYAAPPVDSVNDPDLNFVQTYDLYYETLPASRQARRERRSRTTCRSRPTTSGPKTIPNYDTVAAGAITPLPGGGKTFVGPADDPFFVDLGAIFDGINIDKPGRPDIGLGNQGGGKDDVSGYNTHSFVLQVPEAEVTRDGKPVAGAEGRQRRRRRVGDHRAQARSRSPRPRRTHGRHAGCRSAASATR